MSENVIGFVIWAMCGGIFFVIGVHAFHAKKPVGFWANVKAPVMEEITDVKAYNEAIGKLWIVFSVFFIVLGIPLLTGSHWIILSILAIIFEVIMTMAIYMRIEQKYRKR